MENISCIQLTISQCRNHCAKQLRRLLQLCRAESNQAGRKTHTDTDRPTDRQANSANGRTDI